MAAHKKWTAVEQLIAIGPTRRQRNNKAGREKKNILCRSTSKSRLGLTRLPK